jgi:hypothetical protein
MDETGMQNPIFNLAKSLANQGSNNQNMMNNSMNPGMNQMGQGMNMNNMQMSGMGGMNNMGMNNMNNMNMMNNLQMSGMNNMNNMNMNNMNMNNMGMTGVGGMNMMNNMNMMNPNMGMMNAAMNMNVNMQNNMNDLNNMNAGNPQTTNSQFINVYFKAGANGENGSIMIQCSLNDKISDLIQKYKNKSLEDVSLKKFIFNAKALVPSLTVAEAGLTEGANIFVVNTAGVKGA